MKFDGVFSVSVMLSFLKATLSNPALDYRHAQWLLSQVSAPFYFLPIISQQADVYRAGTCGVTVFDQQTCPVFHN